MKFAISYKTASYGLDPDKIVAYAQHAEACGFEALYLPEHIVMIAWGLLGERRVAVALTGGALFRPITSGAYQDEQPHLAVRSLACRKTSPLGT
jgi:hypothetical protein